MQHSYLVSFCFKKVQSIILMGSKGEKVHSPEEKTANWEG